MKRQALGTLVRKKMQRQHPSLLWDLPSQLARCAFLAAAVALPLPVPAAGWTNTGSLNAASLFHTSTLLPNGKVLIAGGQAASGVTRRAELFDPAAGAWINTTAMSTSRLAHTATLLRNGKVLVAGGWATTGFTNVLNSAELYDPATESWTPTGSMATRRGYHQAVLLADGKVLVAGGAGDDFAGITSTELYDPSTGTWSAAGAMTIGRAGFAAVLLPDGNVLAAGGQPMRSIPVASAEIFSPASSRWTASGSMTFERADFTMIALADGKALAVGGWGNQPELPADTEVYDPASGSWTLTGALNTPRYHTRATLLSNGKVLAAGGEVYDTAFAVTELFDPATGTWANASPLATARRLNSLTLLSNGKVLVAGGVGADLLSSSELYDSPPGTVTPVTLTRTVRLPSGGFRFDFTSVPIPGAAFTVYAATNIAAPMGLWRPQGGAIEVLPGQFRFFDSQAADPPRHFYRVRSP